MDIQDSTLNEMAAVSTGKRRAPRLWLWQFSLGMLFLLMTVSSVLAFGGRHYWPRIRHTILSLIEQPFEQPEPPYTIDHCPGCGMG